MGRSDPAGSVSVAHVELCLAGTFRVVRDGTPLTDGEVGSRKSRTLLKLLAVERPGLVTVDRIVEVLWPDERPAAPEQNVATMVSRLRAALGAEIIQGGRGGYRLAAGPGVVVDLDAAAGFCEQAEGKLAAAAAVALAAAERAHGLLAAGTAIGEEQYADWADPAREQVRELLRRVRLAAAEASLATGDLRQAAGYAEAAIAADPLDEAAHRWYMSASAAAGEQAKALTAYEALRQRLGREPRGTRLLAVATVRAENDTQTGTALAPVARRVEVGPLGPDAVAELARAAGQGELAGRILERTRGHTLFVVEVLRSLASGEEGVPESLRTAVQARVRRAGPPVEALLRVAAVLGATVDPLTVGVMLDLAPATALELCEAALGARLLVVSGRDYEFANDLIREVLYASTPEPTRLAHHRRAADLLTGQPESLARHAAAAGDWLRAGRAWLRAGEDAMSRYAASDAVALATAALEAAERVADAEVSARALVLRGRAHHATGADAAAFADLTQGADGARMAGDRRLEMRALYELGPDITVQRGLPISYNMSKLENGLRIAESLGDRASEAHMLSQLSILAANRLHLDTAVDRGLRGVAAGRMAADDHALASGLDGLKTVYLNLGDIGALTGVLDELLPLLRRLRDPYLTQWAMFENTFPAIAAADWTAATAGIESAIEINKTAGYPHCAAWYVAHQGWLARLRGRLEEAIRLGHQAVELTEQHEVTWWQAAACAMLGDTVLLAGDRASAIALFERGLAAARQADVEAYLLRCAAPLAAATGSRTILGEAAGLLEQAGIPDGGAWMLGYEAYLSLAEAWLAHGDPEQARLVLAPMLAVADREPWIPALAAALATDGRALIRLAGREQPKAERDRAALARAELDRAIRLATQYGLPRVLREARETRRQLR